MKGTRSTSAKSLGTFGKADISKLGMYLKQRRHAAGLTVRQAAERSGVSAGSIRALEEGRSSPSLVTVLGVVEVLGLSIDRAVEASQGAKTRIVVSRHSDDDKHKALSLSEGLIEPRLSARVVNVPPGAIEKVPNDAEDGPSVCMVLSGDVIASLDDAERVNLMRGDSYHAHPGRVRSWANSGDTPAKLLCVVDETRRDGKTTI